MMNTIFVLAILHILFIIYVAPVILILFAVVYVITTKSIDITCKILIIIIIILCILLVFITLIHIKADRPNDLYIKMKRINDSQSMIGLSKEQVVELLGEPRKTHKSSNTDEEVYLYNAGHIFKEITWRDRFTLWAKTYYYVFSVNFDKTDKVKSTLIEKSLKLYVP